MHNLLITVHGLDFGIPAEMTAFVCLARLVYNNDKSRSLGTRQIEIPESGERLEYSLNAVLDDPEES